MSENTGLLSSDVSAGDDGLATQYNNLRADTKKMRQEEMTAGATIDGATLPVPVYQNTSDNEVYACDANVSTALNFFGFAISDGTDGNAIIVQHTGIVGGFTGLQEGQKYYVQDTVGTIGKTPGEYKILVGRAISTTEILIIKEDYEIVKKLYASAVPVSSSTSAADLVSMTIPGGSLGLSKAIKINVQLNVTTGNGASSSTIALKFGGTTIATFTIVSGNYNTVSIGGTIQLIIGNDSNISSQKGAISGAMVTSNNTISNGSYLVNGNSAINSASDATLEVEISGGTYHTITCYGITVELV